MTRRPILRFTILKKLLNFFVKFLMNRNFAYSFILLLASSHIHALNENLFIEKVLQSTHLFESAAIDLKIKEIELLGDERQYSNWHWDLGGEVLLSRRLQNKNTNYTYTHQQI